MNKPTNSPMPWEKAKRDSRRLCNRQDRRMIGKVRTCTVCGREYEPFGVSSLMCKDCKVEQWIEGVMYGVED